MALHFTGIFHTRELRPPTSAALRPGELSLAAMAATLGPPPAAPPPTREAPLPTPPPLTLEVEVATGKRMLLTVPEDAHIEDVAAVVECKTQWPIWLQQYSRLDGVALPLCSPLRRHLPFCRIATQPEPGHDATMHPTHASSAPRLCLHHTAWDEHYILAQYIRRVLPPVAAVTVQPNARVRIEFSHHISILQAPGAATLYMYEPGQEARTVDVTQLWNDLGRVLTLIPKRPLRSGARYKVHVRGSSFQAARPRRVGVGVHEPIVSSSRRSVDSPTPSTPCIHHAVQLSPALTHTESDADSSHVPVTECAADASHPVRGDEWSKDVVSSVYPASRSAPGSPAAAVATEGVRTPPPSLSTTETALFTQPAAVAAASGTCMSSSRALVTSMSQKWWRAGRAALLVKTTNEEAAFDTGPSRAVHQRLAKGGDSWHVRLTDYLWEFRVLPSRS